MIDMSLLQGETRMVAGRYASRAIMGARISNMRDPPAPGATTSITSAGSSPDFLARAMASAVATLWMATSRLATNFMRLPLPNAPR